MATIRELVRVIGPMVSCITPDSGAEMPVSEVVLVGPGDSLIDEVGALLVCTDTVGLFERLKDSRAAGVVIRSGASDPQDWRDCPIPLVVADAELPWHQLLQLLTTAVASAGVPSVSGGAAIGDLFSLANSVAAMVGGAVGIEDPHRRVIAYSSLPDQPIDETRRQGILGRQVPALDGNDEVYRTLYRSPGVVRNVPSEDGFPRLAVAVRNGPEVLGSIWVVESTPLGPEAEVALIDAGRLAAVHLLRARAGSDVERRTRAELLRGLLDGRSSVEVAATRLGLEVNRPVVALGFTLPPAIASDDLNSDAVADLVQLQCNAVRPRSSVLVQLGTVYALLPLEVDTPRARLLKLAQDIVDRARAALRVELQGAVGATVTGLHDVPRTRGDVDAVLRLLARQQAVSVMSVEQALPQVVLLDLSGHLEGSPHLRLPAVERMLAHDADQNTPYADTVLAYLAANADVPTAADTVSVHPNTFRYRMKRVRELFDLDLDDPDVRLVTWLQLRARRSTST